MGGAFVRLLDGTGEFTAEVVASAGGEFRFFAAPGTWTVRALSRSGNGEAELTAGGPGPAPRRGPGRLARSTRLAAQRHSRANLLPEGAVRAFVRATG